MSRDITWQQIVDKVKVKNKSRKLIRDTVFTFYSALESNLVIGCDINVRNLGRFVGSKQRFKKEARIKQLNHTKTKFYLKWAMKRQRLWAKEKFDDNWPTD